MDYIKVRPYVANRLGVLNSRYRYADGNVQLWDKDLSEVDKGWVFRKEEVVAAIGGLMMDPYRNREEQRKPAEECTPLPLPSIGSHAGLAGRGSGVHSSAGFRCSSRLR